MTYKEFKKWCKDNKYAVLESEKYIGVIDEELTTLCGVSKGSEMVCDIRTGSRELIDKALALALTPLEKRDEDKKYKIIIKGIIADDYGVYFCEKDNERVAVLGSEKYIFTKEEADEIIKNISIGMEEVKE